jgi:hypothetical protein
MSRFIGVSVLNTMALGLGLLFAWNGSRAELSQSDGVNFDPSIRPAFSEPVTLASKDGVLEVRLTTKQGTARLDTVAQPVQNFLIFANASRASLVTPVRMEFA